MRRRRWPRAVRHPTHENVLGVPSLVIYSLILVTSVKYIAIVIRADNQGEGGILALTALIPQSNGGRARWKSWSPGHRKGPASASAWDRRLHGRAAAGDPPALAHNLRYNKVLHEHVVTLIVTSTPACPCGGRSCSS